MNATKYAMQLRQEIAEVHAAMVDPGFSEHLAYREALARYHALKKALEMLKISTHEEDETGT